MVRKQGLPSALSAEEFLTDVTRIYIDVYQNSGAIIQRRVNYYSSIRFTVKDKDIYTNITLRIGKAIDVDSIDDFDERSYALIRAIMIHQDDSGRNNSFLLIDWFYRNGSVDPVTGFPIYNLQESNDHSWFHLENPECISYIIAKIIVQNLMTRPIKNILNKFYYLII